ncbi:16S rRNA (cytosine(1402)-N(4))-methyltransferase RsmH [Planctomycetota bacterium]
MPRIRRGKTRRVRPGWIGRTDVDELPIEHIPVLAQAIEESVHYPDDAVVVDATLGQGGHSMLLARRLAESGHLIGFDVAPQALTRTEERLQDMACQVHLIQSNFKHLRVRLLDEGITHVDFLLADLGYSSVQLDDADLGLSFQSDMPLDMRIDRSLETTAADIVNRTDEKTLADLIFEFGQDRASRRIARFIVTQRQREPFRTTGQLAALVAKALYRPGRKRGHRIHPATRTFQALRIAVNRELENLQQLLADLPDVLKPGGRVAIISFHSLEDRLVKFNFRENKASGVYRLLTKKPWVPSEQEIIDNPRARSAKLRIAERL